MHKFTKDSRAEQFLNTLDAEWYYEESFNYSDLPDGWHLNNEGRSKNVEEKAVDDYARLQRETSPIPIPTIIVFCGDPEVGDGVQRLMAAELNGFKAFPCYVVVTDDETVRHTIRVMANPRLNGGHNETKEWSLGKAVEVLVLQCSMSFENVAKLGGWQVKAVRDKYEIFEGRRRLRGIGFDDKKFKDNTIREINRNSTKEDFVQASEAIRNFCNLIEPLPSLDDRMEYIVDFFNIDRHKARYQQFQSKLSRIESDEYLQLHRDPQKKSAAKMGPDLRVLQGLKGVNTKAEAVLASKENLHGSIEEYDMWLNKIRITINAIFNRKGKKK